MSSYPHLLRFLCCTLFCAVIEYEYQRGTIIITPPLKIIRNMEQKTRVYLTHEWFKQKPESFYDFISDFVSSEVTAPTLWVKGEDTGVKCDLELWDCYFDEQGDLYTPTAYNRVSDTSYRDSDSGQYFHETEEVPTNYVLFLTKETVEQQYADYLKDH